MKCKDCGRYGKPGCEFPKQVKPDDGACAAYEEPKEAKGPKK